MGKWLLVLILVCASNLSAQPAPGTLPVGGAIRAFTGSADEIPTPGFHKLVYEFSEDGQPRQLPFSLFLPHGYPGEQSWPMVVFLGGLGDRGADPGIAMSVGVPLEVGRDSELRAWMPMIVLTPQCPNDRVWETPGMSQWVLQLIDAVAKRYPVDRSRLYVTGFSNGGRGCWVLAHDAPGVFAAIAPIVSREHYPDETAGKLAGSGMTCLVISGQKDPKSEPASAHMVSSLRERGVDVVYSPVPDAEHFIWTAYYRQKEFYEFLLCHQKGRPVPADRLTGDQFVQLYTAKKQDTLEQVVFDHRLQWDLDRFEPYWFIDNCGRAGRPGLQPQALGRTGVYRTVPLSLDIPCRLQTTRQLPPDKLTDLQLSVGHQPQTEWQLVVRVNEIEQARQVVNDQTAPAGWLDVQVPLHELAGKEARLQVIHEATTQPTAAAYFSKLKLIEQAR